MGIPILIFIISCICIWVSTRPPPPKTKAALESERQLAAYRKAGEVYDRENKK